MFDASPAICFRTKREMGSFELLTREGESEIAKRIEGGLQAMMLAISASPWVGQLPPEELQALFALR